ncbi:Protein of unknown function (DUF2370) domain containing protein [Naviculisporaceae sp. PSN 640]
MAGRYERVNAHDDDEPETPTGNTLPSQPQPIPNSPPPSFRSRRSSLTSRDRNLQVNPDLADAFESDGAWSDDEADDRQRLVRSNTSPLNTSAPEQLPAAQSQTTSQAAPAPTATASRLRGVFGGGIQSDGVFSNLTAKPERGGPEKEELPPTYEQAAADAAPPYWETTILAPGLGGPDEVYIDGMPVGSFFSFVWNGMISMSFQLVGFLLTYLLHSTHAAKNGSRAGLGVTLITYGFSMKGADDIGAGGMGNDDNSDGSGYSNPPDPNSHNFDPNTVNENTGGGVSEISGSDWIAYIMMVVGWFILIRAVADYLKARRHEQLVLQSPDRGLGIPIIATGEPSERVIGRLHRRSFLNMAWRSSGATNRDLIENLWTNKMISSPQVKSAFLSVDRAHYAPNTSHPYDDSPKSIGYGATISAPHMHASAVENLLPFILPREDRPSPKVLDIGSGSGYLTHILAELVGEKGVVVGVEHIKQLKELGEQNMGKSEEGKGFLRSGRARFRVGDGRKGWVEKGDSSDGEKEIGLWDAIHVGASAAKLHDELLEKLNSPGRMFIPVDDDEGGYSQHIWCVDKDEAGKVEKRKLFGVRYVPLTDAPKN